VSAQHTSGRNPHNMVSGVRIRWWLSPGGGASCPGVLSAGGVCQTLSMIHYVTDVQSTVSKHHPRIMILVITTALSVCVLCREERVCKPDQSQHRLDVNEQRKQTATIALGRAQLSLTRRAS